MKQYSGFKSEAPIKKETLPAGGYVAKILDAKEINYTWGNILLISFDITEDTYKNFFNRDYNNQIYDDKKWRGTLRLHIPKGDGTEQDGWSVKAFNNAIWAIENSNPGYHWDWNEANLKNKITGVLFRNKEWEMNGRTGWTTECCALESADNIRNANYLMPKDKPLTKKSAPPINITSEALDSDDLPF